MGAPAVQRGSARKLSWGRRPYRRSTGVIPRLSENDLLELAAQNHFEVHHTDLGEYARLVDELLALLDELDVPEPWQGGRAHRDPGTRPEPGSDPLNAIV